MEFFTDNEVTIEHDPDFFLQILIYAANFYYLFPIVSLAMHNSLTLHFFRSRFLHKRSKLWL